MQHLSGLDAAFLALGTPAAHMHIPRRRRRRPLALWRRAAIRPSTTGCVPSSKLASTSSRRCAGASVSVPFGLYVPSWIDDPDFDLDYHIVRAALPAPGGPKELEAFAASVASRPLDRNKPLWEVYIVEGLEHGYQAFITKIHHSLVDGIAGVAIIAALFDLDANAPLVPADGPPDTFQPEAVPSETEMLTRAVIALGSHPQKIAHAVTRSVPGVVRAVRRARDESLSVALPLTAPKLTMNRNITAHRVIAFSSLALADVKAVKNALGVTVNDVVLAVNAGALRNYLLRRRELPEKPLVASIPTSVRAADDTGFGNRVSSMFAALPVEIADPIERLHYVAESMSGAKGVHEEIADSTLQDWAELGGAGAVYARDARVLAAAYRRTHRAADQSRGVERARSTLAALLRGRAARRVAPARPDLRRHRPQCNGDLVPRPHRLRLHRVPRAASRHQRPRERRSRRAERA